MYPEKLAGVPDALIFFWFFSCIKARKESLPMARKFAGYVRRMGEGKSLYFFHLTTSFLSLMKEKRQKKIKPSRMAFSPRVREREGTKMDA